MQTSSSDSGKLEQPQQPLPLPAPESTQQAAPEAARQIDVNSAQKITLDDLGPMVVNSDGTLSRIANWQNMTGAERERTLRVLSARNRLRLANEEKKLREQGNAAGAVGSDGDADTTDAPTNSGLSSRLSILESSGANGDEGAPKVKES